MNPADWQAFTLELEALGDEGTVWSTYRQQVDQVCSRFGDRLDATVMAESAAFYLIWNALEWDEPAVVVVPLLEAYLGFPLSTLRKLQVIVEALRWSRRVPAAEGFEAEYRTRLTELRAKVDRVDWFQANNILARLEGE